MDRRRARGLPAALILSLSLVLIPVSAAMPLDVAAAGCSLAAPATVPVGSTVVIVGSQFPTNTTVDVSVALNGSAADQFTVGSDQNGTFQITLTAELQDVGRTTVDASVDSICSARAVFNVVVPGSTLPPAPTATPTPRPTATPGRTPISQRTPTPKPVVSAAGSAAATPPRSNTQSSLPADSHPTGWLVGLEILLLGISGLIGVAIVRRSRG